MSFWPTCCHKNEQFNFSMQSYSTSGSTSLERSLIGDSQNHSLKQTPAWKIYDY